MSCAGTVPWKIPNIFVGHRSLTFCLLSPEAFVDLTREIFQLVESGNIKIQDGWEGVKSGVVPNTVHSSEEVTKGGRQCLC